MARFEFRLPDIGEGVTEGEIVAWHVQPGSVVREDDPMVDVMTDKATVTIGAPRAGSIAELRYRVGQVARVGEVLVVIETEAGTTAEAPSLAAASEQAAVSPATPQATTTRAEPAATAVGDIRESLPGTSFFARRGNGKGAASLPTAANTEYFEPRPLATPATRKLARDLGVDLRRVRPTGPGGRVTRDDVRAAAAVAPTALQTVLSPVTASGPSPTLATHAATTAPSVSAAARDASPPASRVEVSVPGPAARDERIPFVGIRRRIAERMQLARRTAAHFTFVEECACDRLVELRERLAPAAASAGVKITFLPIIAKAVVAALRRHPMLNATLDEAAGEIVLRREYHIGIATATDAGLLVPVVRDADRRSILEIAMEIERLAEGARRGTLRPQDLVGSTFTITSLGKQGGLFATPILNMPEVAILGVHRMRERPVVRDGRVEVGKVMLLSLSFDHRIVDGHVGAAFAYELIDYLENPDRLFLEMA
ncbi:MAG: 2-oxo acid dehydrogenase subunit E2 [Myxococcota bacterium]|nr:2-oxo acid dehydrogenase subunit E2 [Myxococcota bacterium]MDW8362508.1 dihydrolipoamide acetyltransferase family protein [Myxococcales bacterium]